MQSVWTLKLCIVAIAASAIGATCAQAKSDAKTALDDAAAACRADAPQGLVAIVDPQAGGIVQIVCAAAGEIDAVLAPILGAAATAPAAPGAACDPGSSVAIAVDAQGAETKRWCLTRAQAETAAAAIADRRKAAAP